MECKWTTFEYISSSVHLMFGGHTCCPTSGRVRAFLIDDYSIYSCIVGVTSSHRHLATSRVRCCSGGAFHSLERRIRNKCISCNVIVLHLVCYRWLQYYCSLLDADLTSERGQRTQDTIQRIPNTEQRTPYDDTRRQRRRHGPSRSRAVVLKSQVLLVSVSIARQLLTKV